MPRLPKAAGVDAPPPDAGADAPTSHLGSVAQPADGGAARSGPSAHGAGVAPPPPPPTQSTQRSVSMMIRKRVAGAPHPSTQAKRRAIGAPLKNTPPLWRAGASQPRDVDDASPPARGSSSSHAAQHRAADAGNLLSEERAALGPRPPKHPPPLWCASASQPRDDNDVKAWPEGHFCQRLVETLTNTCLKEIMGFMVEAHRQTTAARAIPQATWRDGSLSKVFTR